jgi:hypothetical protein
MVEGKRKGGKDGGEAGGGGGAALAEGRGSTGSGHKGYRRDGFTPEKKKICIAALEQYGTIADACRTAKISDTSFYRHHRKDAAFRGQCEAALAKASSQIETLAWERGVTGIEEEVIHYGKVVGKRRKRSDAVFRMILQASNPDKYGRAGAALRARIEAQLRPEIEARIRAEIDAEMAEEVADGKVAERIHRKLEKVRERMIESGYSEGPDGSLAPPGWMMVRKPDGGGGEGGGGEGGEPGQAAAGEEAG